jgi:nucleoside-diphosphate-sugar epimerase
MLLPRLLKLVRNGKMIRAGDMNARLSMTHYSNFARAIEQCIDAPKTGIHVYNVADDEIYILYQVVRKLLNALYERDLPRKRVPVWVLELMSAMGIGDVTQLFIDTVTKDLVLDISKIKAELNYSPTVTFYESTSEITAWVKKVGGVDIVRKGSSELAWES